jgi:hypothetical protein
VERSRQARIQLARYARELRVDDRIEIRSDLTELHGGLPDCRVALLLFGVLGHMTFDQRRETLDWVRACLAPDARVIGSVPNRARRFRREQRLSRIPDGGLAPRFAYERTIDGVTDVFEYTAFSPRDLAQELREHSWTCLSLTPESVMTERIATRWDAAGRIDSVLTHLLPPGLGYCIAFEAVADRSRVSTVHPMCDARRLRAS